MIRLAVMVPTVFLAACAQAPRQDPIVRERCLALVDSHPEMWRVTVPAVLELGADAAPTLIECLRETPQCRGLQAAIATLGKLGNPAAVDFLEELLVSNDLHASEAALSLGRLESVESVELLREVTWNHARSSVTRTAAACALMDLGHGREVLPFLCAALLADVPAGKQLSIDHGLPNRTRWALQRYMIISTISRRTGGETFGLDPDSSWPAFEAGVARFSAHIERDQEK